MTDDIKKDTSDFLNFDPEKNKASFEKHALEPNVSLEDHIRQLRIELGKSISDKKKIYLDTSYWGFIRNVARNNSQVDTIDIELFNQLKRIVKSGIGICPISAPIFVELMGQSIFNNRRTTAQCIDELSLGITISPEEERTGTELAHSLYYYSATDKSTIYPLNYLVWLKLCFIFGETYLTLPAIDLSEARLIQKTFTDYLWDMSLTQMIDVLNLSNDCSMLSAKPSTKKMNEGILKHVDEIESFNTAYEIEMIGVLDLYKGRMADILNQKYERHIGQKYTPTLEERENCEADNLRLFIATVKSGKAHILCPTLHIKSKCHAYVRWNKGQKIISNKPIDSNDLFDFEHAATAIGYCDVFFTFDKNLHKLLTSDEVDLDKEFKCKVIYEKERAIEYLKGIGNL